VDSDLLIMVGGFMVGVAIVTKKYGFQLLDIYITIEPAGIMIARQVVMDILVYI